jgi:hypothetical protein
LRNNREGQKEAGMKKLILTICVCLPAFLLSCSEKQGPTGFDRIFERLSRAKGFDAIRQCYTSGTVSAVEDAVSAGVISEKEKLLVFPRFNEKTKWEEIMTRTDGSRGVMRIRYLDHPYQNMVGYTMDFRLKKEGNSWKIDLEDEVRTALKGRRGTSPSEYIKKIKNKY